MRCYEDICRAPISSLSIAENALLQLEDEVLRVRQKANEVRLNWWMDRRDMQYLIGSFNGVRFAMLTMISDFGIYRDWKEFRDIADSYATEIEFLSTRYIQREAA
jgi:hypothetical protein